MEIYKFDWKDLVYGSIEIEAESGNAAEQKLMNMSIKELIKNSKYDTDKDDRKIRFVSSGEDFQDMDEEEWNKIKNNL